MLSMLKNHKTLSVLGGIILALIILIAASYSLKNDEGWVGDTAKTVVYWVQRPFVLAADFISHNVSGIFSDDELEQKAEDLQAQVDALEEELLISRLSEDELRELKGLARIFDDEGFAAGVKIKSANVVSYDGSNIFNVFTINVGSDEGAERDTVVVAGLGLAGRVVSAGPGWSKVVTIIDESNKIGFEVRAEGTYLGVCAGDGEGNLKGTFLDEAAKTSVGAPVYTSGVGGIYPPNLLIGYVSATEVGSGSSLLTITVKPAVNFSNLRKVGLLI